MTTQTQAPTAPSPLLHSDGPTVPVQTRSERLTSFDPEDFAMPTGREVNFKQTPVAKLATVLVDEATSADAVTYNVSDESVLVPSEGLNAPIRGEFFRPEDRMSAIAWKRSENAIHLRVPQDAEIDTPVIVRITGHGATLHANAHIIIEALPNSKATIVLDHRGSAQYAQNVEILVRDGAKLKVATLQRWDAETVHTAAHQARVDKDAELTHIVATLSGAVVRVNPSLELSGAGSHGYMWGVSFADPGQHLESQVYLHHKGPNTTGDVLYKSALQGETARTVWIGDVLIGPEAVATDSYEANRNLVLTPGARADSIPNLEIETGDIQGAGHASATGRFDDEQLFYLQARGISEDEARRLVVVGFLGEIVQKIGIDTLEEELFNAISVELEEGVTA